MSDFVVPEPDPVATDADYRIWGGSGVRIWLFLRGEGEWGATDFEGQEALKLSPTTYTIQRGRLRRDGLVVARGDRRRNPTGRLALIWRAA